MTNRHSSTSHWITIYTKPKQEGIAMTNIIRQGYDVYCPMVMRRVSHARKVQTVLRPLFPNYIFVKLEQHKQQWRPLLSTKGVTSVVCFDNKPSLLPATLIDQLRSSEAEGNLVESTAPQFKPGDEVNITDGPFKNFIAKTLSVADKDRIWLMLDLMGQSVRTKHETWSISPRS